MASRPRMTYQAPGQVHEQARQELFAGAQPAAGPAPGATNYGARGGVQQLAREDLEYMDGRQIMDHAVAQHKDTTATARRALQVVEQTKELQASTVGALQDQGQQLVRIGHGMNKIGTDLTYSQRLLRYMRMCCCVGFCCASCTEPERDVQDRNWREGAPQPPRGPPPGAAGKAPAAAGKKAKAGAPGPAAPPPQYAPVGTAGLAEAGYGDQAKVIQSETREQDVILDQIAQGLDQLKHGALAMQEEIHRQDHNVNRLHGDAHLLHSKLTAVNRDGFKF